MKALPDKVELKFDENDENPRIPIEGSELTVKEAHNLIVSVGKAWPHKPELIKFVNSFLKQSEFILLDTDSMSTCLSEAECSDGKLKWNVNIPNSLKDVLKAGIKGEYKQSESELIKHKVSVVVQITKPDDMTNVEEYEYLCYNDHTQFTLTDTELTETVFNGEITEIQALLALIAVLKCQPISDWGFLFWDAWLHGSRDSVESAGKR